MKDKKTYRIVCLYPSDQWVVQEQVTNCEWMTAHHCELKGEQGYYEAKAWIENEKTK